MMGSRDYPRVLVVGQHFDRSSGGGITLSNLFEGWPQDSLAAAAGTQQVADIETDVCANYYVLGSTETVWVWPLSMVPRTLTPLSGPRESGGAARKPAPPADGPAGGDSMRSLAIDGLRSLGVLDTLRTTRLSPQLLAWVREFDPDVIYSQLASLPVMALVNDLCDETGVPLALHFMDDWPSTAYGTGLLAPPVRRRMRELLGSLVGRSTVTLAISDLMAKEYAERYGREFVALHNPVDLERWDSLAAEYAGEAGSGHQGRLDVLYAGRVGTANAEALGSLASVISAMVAAGDRIALRLFTSDLDRPEVVRMTGLPGVEVNRAVPYSRIPALLATADVLALPLDFDETGARFSRLSMPTKLSEYLASGRPVLVYAPAGSAVAEYARESGWARLVDERDPQELRGALESLLSDEQGLNSMGVAARDAVRQRHDATVVRERLRSALASAPDPPDPSHGALGPLS